MLRKESLYNMVESLCVNFSIDKTEEELKAYCLVIYTILQTEDVTDKEFADACIMFMKTTTGNNFKSLPSAGDFLKQIGKTPKSIEDMAREEANKVFSTNFDLINDIENPVTCYVLKFCCGGLDNFINEYQCKYKEDKRAVQFRKQEFIKDWILCYENKKYHYELLSVGGFIPRDTKVALIGSTQQLDKLMLENKTEHTKPAIDSVKLLASKMKG